MHVLKKEGATMAIARNALWLFLLPGNLVCDLAGATSGDDRAMIRTLINMLAWNFVAVMAVVALW